MLWAKMAFNLMQCGSFCVSKCNRRLRNSEKRNVLEEVSTMEDVCTMG